MTDKERLEEWIKDKQEQLQNATVFINENGNEAVEVSLTVLSKLFEQVERVQEQDDQINNMAHVIKIKNKEMRELSDFLKDRSIPLKKLSPLITVMNHVQALEEKRENNLKNLIYQQERIFELEQQNIRYREALEKIITNQTKAPTKYGKTSEIARKALEIDDND